MENIELDIDFFNKYFKINQCKCMDCLSNSHFFLFKQIGKDKNLKNVIIENFLRLETPKVSNESIFDAFGLLTHEEEPTIYPASNMLILSLSIGSIKMGLKRAKSFSLEFSYYFMTHFLFYTKNDSDVIIKIINKHPVLLGYLKHLNFAVNIISLDEKLVTLYENIPWDFEHININNYNNYSFDFLIKFLNKLNRKISINIHKHKDFDFKKLIYGFVNINPYSTIINWKELSIHPLLDMDLVVDTIINKGCKNWNFFHLTTNEKLKYDHAMKILRCNHKKIVIKFVKHFDNLLNLEWMNSYFINNIGILNDIDRIYYLYMIEKDSSESRCRERGRKLWQEIITKAMAPDRLFYWYLDNYELDYEFNSVLPEDHPRYGLTPKISKPF